jgi:tryptophan-rich sensory protein
MTQYLKLAIWIIVFLAISFGIGQVTQGGMQDWYQNLEKPSFNPPNYIFPIVWSILYVMIAVAGWNMWRVGASKPLKIIFSVYMLMNWLWTPIFFGLHQITMGLVWIVALSLVNLIFIIKAWRSVRLSALLMIPLLAWTSFASLLSYFIWALN